MHKQDPRYNGWLKRRIKKKEKHRLKRRKISSIRSRDERNINAVQAPMRRKKNYAYRVVAPSNFSIKDNGQEIVEFFEKILQFTNSRKENENIFFDLSNIVNISADAVIYLLAVIKDLQHTGFVKHSFYGNVPKHPQAKEFFENSGFKKYVSSGYVEDTQNPNKIQILSNNIYDQTTTRDVCDFVCSCSHCTRVDTKFLYVLINEMMLNTCQHAYNEGLKQTNSWYLYVENDGKKIKFTFLDTGQGIPSTVKKKFWERILKKSDSEIISSALNGDFRTNTGYKYRGKGLPKIKDCVADHNLDNFFVVSNKAICELKYINDNLEIEKKDLKNAFSGTIYYWELEIKGDKND